MRLAAALFLMIAALPAAAFETSARAAYVVDYGTGTVLLSKNADQALPPASMSKLMTLFMVFEALQQGRLTLDETLPVSQHAMDYGGSTMFLNTRDRVSVQDLILGVIVLSGNDASAVLAEALSPDGTEAGFARAMTQRAKQLGMENSRFANSNGWPDPGQQMSMRDLGILADHLIRDFPEYYGWFARTEFLFDGRAPGNRHNRNPLLKAPIGADGLKTGHTSEAGYGLVGSAVQGNRRVIFVLTGLDSEAARASESEKIANWAFRQFAEKKILEAGAEVGRAPVFFGRAVDVGLQVAADVSALLPVLAGDSLSGRIELVSPVEAPIQAGQQIAELVIEVDGQSARRVPLVAAEAVERAGFFGRLRIAFSRLTNAL